MEGGGLHRYVLQSVADPVRQVWLTIEDEDAWAERAEAVRGSD
jgi:hypothetical protein